MVMNTYISVTFFFFGGPGGGEGGVHVVIIVTYKIWYLYFYNYLHFPYEMYINHLSRHSQTNL